MAIIKRNKLTIFGLDAELKRVDAVSEGLAQETQTRQRQIGNMEDFPYSDLTTALKQLAQEGDVASEASAKRANNLTDLDDIEKAREALSVLSVDEIGVMIEQAKIDLGTNFTVDTLADRDALEHIDVQDRVFVRDIDDDGAWGQYKPMVIDETTGEVTEWLTLMTSTTLENIVSGPSIKAAYESNDDTNAFTDIDKAKVAGLNENDRVLHESGLVKTLESLEQLSSDDSVNAPVSARLLADAFAQAIDMARPRFVRETLTVHGDLIELTHAPIGGSEAILNFSCVRYIDPEGSAWDATTTIALDEDTRDVIPNTRRIEVDTPGQWDGLTVTIEYLAAYPRPTPTDDVLSQ